MRRDGLPASTRSGSGLTSTLSSIRRPMAEPTRGLLDTSVVVDHDLVDADRLPDESAIAAVTLAELSAGPHATGDDDERARRQDRLQWAAATWDPLPFDAEAARAYGRVFAATRAAGRSARPRLADLLIAATAVANGLDLYTRNGQDFVGLEAILTVIVV
jgi:predicted nucleic acid-binding protein